MTITEQEFLINANKYLYSPNVITIATASGNRFLLSAQELENIELLSVMDKADKDIDKGNFSTHEQVWNKIDKILAQI